ncbi:HAD-IIIA family hydrolase [Candidatus Pacearchaeota archaeon]|nr:HAD-IIIA family hydrolase [Candidatus Pacearchaeota archaeon]
MKEKEKKEAGKSKKPKVKLVVFDLWHTLAYRKTKLSSLNIIAKKFNLNFLWRHYVDIFEESTQTKKYKTKREAYSNFLKNLHLPVTNKNVDYVIKLRTDLEAKSALYPHVIPMLRKLKKQGIKIGLLTNSTCFAINVIREKTRLLNYIDILLPSYECGSIKPKPKGFKLMLKKGKVKPSESVMIGDKIYADVHPAQKLGMNAIHFKNYKQLKKEMALLEIEI